MRVNKWDFKKHEYNEVEIPYGWNIKLHSFDMNIKVNCVNCGCVKTYGECYTSRQYHDGFGFGYAVCEDCYQNEWTLEAAACNG